MTALLLGYHDLPNARNFLIAALGFEEEWSESDPSGELVRSHMRLGDTVLMIDSPGAHGVKSPRDVGGVTHLIVVNVGNVEEHFERAAGAGAAIHGPPSERPWGLEYGVTDPEGYVFNFIE